VGDDDAAHLRISERDGTTLCKRAPHAELHVLAVHLCDLLGHQTAARCRFQARYGMQQLLDTYLRGSVANVVSRSGSFAGDGSARPQNHNFLPAHLHPLKNW